MGRLSSSFARDAQNIDDDAQDMLRRPRRVRCEQLYPLRGHDPKPVPHCLLDALDLFNGNGAHVADRIAQMNEEPGFLDQTFIPDQVVETLFPVLFDHFQELRQRQEC
jgi:hypothetical protein